MRLLTALVIPIFLLGCGIESEDSQLVDVNQPPVIEVQLITAAFEGRFVQIHTDVYDPENDDVSYHWQQTVGRTVSIVPPHSSTLSFQAHNVDEDETLHFSFFATDEHGNSSEKVIMVLIKDRTIEQNNDFSGSGNSFGGNQSGSGNNNATDDEADNAADGNAGDTTDDVTDDVADNATGDNAGDTTDDVTDDVADGVVDNATDDNADDTTDDVTDDVADNSTGDNADDSTDDTKVYEEKPILTDDSEVVFFNFDMEDGVMTTPSSRLERKSSQEECYYWGDGLGFDKYCDMTSGERFYLSYMKSYESDHMGYLRFGAMEQGMSASVDGESSLSVTLTGGKRHDSEGNIALEGESVMSLDTLKQHEQAGTPHLFSNYTLPGWAMLINGMKSTTETIPHFKNSNRFSLWVWYPKDKKRHRRYHRWDKEKHAPARSINWHPFIDDSRGGHYYHQVSNRAYGGWIKVLFDANPTHHNAGINTPHKHIPYGGWEATGDGVDYFNRITLSQVVLYHARYQASPYSFLTDRWSTHLVTEENDETIASLAVGFDQERERFDISFEDKYRCLTCHGRYQVFYSFQPIDNENVENAKSIKNIENFFVDDDGGNLIVKPNPGYNQVWATFSIDKNDLSRFRQGDVVYFAVVDKSEREFAYEQEDNELIVLTSGRTLKRRDLVKTIKYQYRKPPVIASIQGVRDVSIAFGENKTLTLDYDHMPTGVSFRITGDDLGETVKEAQGKLQVSMQGSRIGNYFMSVEAVQSDRVVARHLLRVSVERNDCRYQSECQLKPLLMVEQGEISTPLSSWQNLLKSNAVDAKDNALFTVIGSNADYHYVGVSGEGNAPYHDDDVIAVTITNTEEYAVDVHPKISFTEASYQKEHQSNWHWLRQMEIPKMSDVTWYINPKDIDVNRANIINIHLEDHVRTLGITKIESIRR